MKLTYTVAAEEYQQAIEFQIWLKQKTLFSRLRYWLGSWGLFVMSLYFGLFRPEYTPLMRILPIVAAGIMLAVASWIRYGVKRRAKNMLTKYVKAGVLNEGFFGQHMLSVRKDTILVEYGRTSEKIFCRQVENLYRDEKASYLMANGVIFDIIPNAVLDQDGCRENLTELIRNNILELQQRQSQLQREKIEAESPLTFGSCAADRERTARGMAAGYRTYYRTVGAWKGHQTICTLILVYGLVMFFANLDKMIGLLFIIIGLALNRRVLIAFSPLALETARKSLEKEGYGRMADDFFYTTDREIVTVSFGQEFRCNKRDVVEKRKTKEFLIFYTKNQQMAVIHKAALEKPEDLIRFKNLL